DDVHADDSPLTDQPVDEVADGVREGYSSPIRRASEMPWIDGIYQIGIRGTSSARSQEVKDALAFPYFRRQKTWEGGASPTGAATGRSPPASRGTKTRWSRPISMPRSPPDITLPSDYNGAEQ